MEEIKEYYDKLASDYDDDRFGNSYGKYLEHQEKVLIKKLLNDTQGGYVLDVGCGTGRFLEYATHGIDISENMILISQKKFSGKNLSVQNAAHTNFQNENFSFIISFHMFMHLNKETTRVIFAEMHRLLKKGGTLIFDIPSADRRRILNHTAPGWHGANAFSPASVKELLGDQWEVKGYYGIAFFPIHLIPVFLRNALRRIDSILCHTFLKRYSSYLLFEVRKK